MYAWTVLISLAALVFYFITGFNVGSNRRRHGIAPPAMSGHPEVERALRVQGNTLEWMMIFLPVLWFFSIYWDTRLGAALGAIWIVGRVLYMNGYMRDPAKRGPGFAIQALVCVVLLLGASAGAIRALVQG